MKRVLMIFLSIILLIQPMSTYAAVDKDNIPFSDVKGHWAEETIKKHYNMGMLKGYPDGTFKPDQKMLRVELIALINRYFGLTEESDESFTDVLGKEWYAEDAAKAKYYKYIEELQLRPKEEATREDVINMLSLILDIEEQKDKNKKVEFKDLEGINEETKEKIEKFSQLGYINGYGDSTFKPNGAINRAEIMTIVENTLGYIVRNQEDMDNLPDGVGKITIIGSDIVIENKKINGDIYISQGVSGNIIIKDTEVEGQIEIAGGNKDKPLTLENVKTKKLVITKSKQTPLVIIKGKSKIDKLKTKSETNIEILGETEIKETSTEAKTKLKLGEKSEITSLVIKEQTELTTTIGSTIGKLEIKSKTTITGKGEIKKAYIKSKEVTIENKPKYTKVDNKVGKIDIGGKKVGSRNDDYHTSSRGSGDTKPSDTTAPIINDKTIKIDNTTDNCIDLSFAKATDNVTTSSQLEYLVYYSTENNLDTIENIEANGTTVGAFEVNINTKTVAGLTENTTYYFNIIVKDKAENKSAYTSVSQKTPDTSAATIDNKALTVSNITENSIDVSWTKATDNVTTSSQLEYLVYYSTEDNLDTIENIEANGTTVGAFEANIDTKTVAGLTENTTYYFNVIVKDESENRSAYLAANGTTTKSEVLPNLDGSGTIENPYKIYTIEDLEQIRLGISSHYIILNDLDFKNPASYRTGVVNIEYTDKDKKGWVPINGTISEEEKYEQFKKAIIGLYTWQRDPDEYYPGELTPEVEKLIKKLNEYEIDKDSSRKEIFDVAKISIDIYYKIGCLYEMGNMDNIDDVYNLSDQEIIDLCIKNDMGDIEMNIPFTGSIDGDNHTISNLMINREEEYQGLIGKTDSDAIIKNLTLINCDIKSKSNSGSLIGAAQNTSIINCKVKDIIIMTCKSDDPSNTESEFGGLVGSFDEGLISNCSVDNISIQGDSSDIGGLVGNSDKSEISNCNVSNVNIKGEGSIGGLAGKNYGTINLCTIKDVNIEANNQLVGGFAGGYCGNISNSSVDNVNIISSESDQVGGFIGSYSGNKYYGNKIENCSATNINIVALQYVGGFVGYIDNEYDCILINNNAVGTVAAVEIVGGFAGFIKNKNNYKQEIIGCYSDCNVLPIVDDKGITKDGGCRGGFIAQLINANINKCYSLGDLQSTNGQIGSFVGEMVLSTISNSYATGSVTGNSKVGGFVGKTDKTATIENCYTTGKVSGDSDVGGFIAKSGDSTYSSKNILTISNCVAFNKDGIIGNTNSHINRFASQNDAMHKDYLKEIIYKNNYAYKNMIIKANGEVITGESNAQSLWGADIETLTDKDNLPLSNWDFTDVWDIKDGADRPTLIGVGDDDGKSN